jgi:hypothetical protein
MEYTEALNQLQKSPTFTDWKKDHSNTHLAHFFAQLDQNLMPLNWEIGYYDKDQDLVTTFTVNQDIAINPAAQAFKEKDTITKLKPEEAKLSSEDALHKAKELQMEKYPQHPPLKGFIILQHLETTLWNITFITQTFAALNVKLDAATGDILHHNLATFFDMRAK